MQLQRFLAFLSLAVLAGGVSPSSVSHLDRSLASAQESRAAKSSAPYLLPVSGKGVAPKPPVPEYLAPGAPTKVGGSPTSAKPAPSSVKPGATAKPAAGAKPGASVKPSASAKPSAKAKPATSAKPTVSTKPSASAKPTVSAKPAATPKPVKPSVAPAKSAKSTKRSIVNKTSEETDGEQS